MKVYCNLLLVLIVTTCNQQVYDQLYKAVVEANLNIEINKLHNMNRHFQYAVDYEEPQKADFEILRKLCNGQKSTLERK